MPNTNPPLYTVEELASLFTDLTSSGHGKATVEIRGSDETYDIEKRMYSGVETQHDGSERVVFDSWNFQPDNPDR
jgi:hypothetical protein